MKTFTFGQGAHETREEGMCVMEAAAYIAGERHTDMPKCSDLWISRMCQKLNDCCTDKYRQEKLQELPWRVIGTNSSYHEQTRKDMVIDYISNKYMGRTNPYMNIMPTTYVTIHLHQFKKSHTEQEYDALCDEVLDLIDRMIKLTEIREETLERQTQHSLIDSLATA